MSVAADPLLDAFGRLVDGVKELRTAATSRALGAADAECLELPGNSREVNDSAPVAATVDSRDSGRRRRRLPCQSAAARHGSSHPPAVGDENQIAESVEDVQVTSEIIQGVGERARQKL